MGKKFCNFYSPFPNSRCIIARGLNDEFRFSKKAKKFGNLDIKEIWTYSSEKSAFSSSNMSEFSSSA